MQKNITRIWTWKARETIWAPGTLGMLAGVAPIKSQLRVPTTSEQVAVIVLPS
ncbi:hypothetical protein ABES23_10270 [Peribacillus frigoritolerans]|uniref:hypothetical protein n=1 Tax=Peribacillus frigoritolerans TaxID=450367 RepID=UPI003D273735